MGVSAREYRKGSKLGKESSLQHADSRMLVEAHSVEKGLGLRNVQPGHSGKIVNHLLDTLLEMSSDSAKTRAFPFRETLRIVIAYMDFQEGFDTGSFAQYGELRKKYDRLCDPNHTFTDKYRRFMPE